MKRLGGIQADLREGWREGSREERVRLNVSDESKGGRE